MARSANRLIDGKPRTLGGGARPWRAKLDGPSGRYPGYRVHFKEEQPDGTWQWTSRNPEEHTEAHARALFARVEAALDAVRPAPARMRVAAERTMQALGEMYVTDSRARHKGVRTVEGRESKLRAHIVPAIGDVPVASWNLDHSRKVIERASRTVTSASGLGDVRAVLSAMRRLAWREGWLDRSVDPLDGLEMPRRARLQGAADGFVPVEERPERHQVDAMARAGDYLTVHGHGATAEVTRLPLFGLKVRLAGYGGLRMSEQHGLRAIDVFFESRYIHVNGSWTQPRAADAAPFRGPVKNHTVHEVPLPRTLLDALLPRCAVLLGLPAGATQQQVVNAQRKERARRAKLAQQSRDSSLEWWNYSVDTAEEGWVFIDTTTGLPPRGEFHNRVWHKVRRWVDKNDPEHAWPEFIVYRNLRHHAATFWHDELGREWVDVANFLGDTLNTVLAHYVRSGSEALKQTADALEAW